MKSPVPVGSDIQNIYAFLEDQVITFLFGKLYYSQRTQIFSIAQRKASRMKSFGLIPPLQGIPKKIFALHWPRLPLSF